MLSDLGRLPMLWECNICVGLARCIYWCESSYNQVLYLLIFVVLRKRNISVKSMYLSFLFYIVTRIKVRICELSFK